MTSSRTAAQGLVRKDFSSLLSRPLGVPTRYRTGGCEARIRASVSSLGMPRSITQTRSAVPYWASILARKAVRVCLSSVLPDRTS